MFRAAFLILFVSLLFISSSSAQTTAQRDARNLAILRAVINFKIDDEETLRDVEALREDEAFVRRLQGMLERLTNSRMKDSRNRRVMNILIQAGDDLHNVLR